MKQRDKALTAIDLFCGAGGLTLGLKRAGFNVVAGVEINPEIAKTYKANHPMTKLLIRDVREITGKEILELTGLKEIDLIAGCPPCQGFTTLTTKYHRKDPRNDPQNGHDGKRSGTSKPRKTFIGRVRWKVGIHRVLGK